MELYSETTLTEITLLGFAFVLINVLIDVLYTFIDPRVRYD